MLVSAVVCPHPPALIPVISQGGSDRLDAVRGAAIGAVRTLGHVDSDLLVCVGAGDTTRRWQSEAGGSLSSFGVDLRFGGPHDQLPMSLCVARYLLDEAGISSPDILLSVAHDESPEMCRDLGAEIAEGRARVALLVMGDGSAKRSRTSPGYFHPAAESFDKMVADALRTADAPALLAIEPEQAVELWAAGRPSWQILAGALGHSGSFRGEIAYDGAPLGVGYLVSLLTLAPTEGLERR